MLSGETELTIWMSIVHRVRRVLLYAFPAKQPEAIVLIDVARHEVTCWRGWQARVEGISEGRDDRHTLVRTVLSSTAAAQESCAHDLFQGIHITGRRSRIAGEDHDEGSRTAARNAATHADHSGRRRVSRDRLSRSLGPPAGLHAPVRR